MNWIKYSTLQPTREGWYLVHYSREADRPGTYWQFWAYKALYWNPVVGRWTEDARPPDQGGRVVDVAIELWTEIFCMN